MRQGYVLAILSMLAASFSQLAMKWGMSQIPADIQLLQWNQFLLYQTSFMWIIYASIAYLCSILLWIKTLTLLPLSLAYPLLSISYILVYLYAVFSDLFLQQWHHQATLGIFFILGGILLIYSKPMQPHNTQQRISI